MCSFNPSLVTKVSEQTLQQIPRGDDEDGDSLELLLSGDDVGLC